MAEHGAARLPTSIECMVGGERTHVLVDTGATYSVISPAFLEGLRDVERTGVTVDFRHGQTKHTGELWRIPVTLLAEEGQDFELIAQFCVAEDWVRPVTVLGVRFCLEELNIGLEPVAHAGAMGRLHFGPARSTG